MGLISSAGWGGGKEEKRKKTRPKTHEREGKEGVGALDLASCTVRGVTNFSFGPKPFARLPPFLVRGDDTSFPLVIPRGLLVPHRLPVTSAPHASAINCGPFGFTSKEGRRFSFSRMGGRMGKPGS